MNFWAAGFGLAVVGFWAVNQWAEKPLHLSHTFIYTLALKQINLFMKKFACVTAKDVVIVVHAGILLP